MKSADTVAMEATTGPSDKLVSTEKLSPPDEKVSQAIVRKIADIEGTSPTEVTPPLYSAIDPDALDAFFSTPAAGRPRTGRDIRFTYHGYEVRVRDGEEISIVEP